MSKREYEVFWPENESEEDSDSELHIQLTEEGVIVDVFDGGEGVGTWAMTAQELTEMIHENQKAWAEAHAIKEEPPTGLSGNYFPVST